MSKTKRATINLQKTGWNTMEVAGKLDVSPRLARMYLKGQRKIPTRLWSIIPIAKLKYDTSLKIRTRKEKKINEIKVLKKYYAIKVPRFTLLNEFFFILLHRNRILSRRNILILCITERLAAFRMTALSALMAGPVLKGYSALR
jgi:hypothetical protein